MLSCSHLINGTCVRWSCADAYRKWMPSGATATEDGTPKGSRARNPTTLATIDRIATNPIVDQTNEGDPERIIQTMIAASAPATATKATRRVWTLRGGGARFGRHSSDGSDTSVNSPGGPAGCARIFRRWRNRRETERRPRAIAAMPRIARAPKPIGRLSVGEAGVGASRTAASANGRMPDPKTTRAVNPASTAIPRVAGAVP